MLPIPMSVRSLRCRAFAPALFALVLACIASACSSTSIDLAAWRKTELAAAPVATQGPIPEELTRVDRLREERRLAEARTLALRLAAEHADDAGALIRASRAESDGVFLFPEDDKPSRNHAAASALDFALRARERGASTASELAQVAWALGTSTHLQPMFDRSAHAKRTLATAHEALALEPGEPTALATVALVNLRLETLPWIASAMAWTAPDSSLEDAEAFARGACESLPSRENLQILAKVLIASDRAAEAREVLDRALASPPRFARDTVLEPALAKLRASLD